MNDKELDRLFRQKLDSMEETPSAGAWQQLEAGLQHKKQKQKKLWAYVSGIAAAFLLLLGSWGAFEYSQQMLPAEQIAETSSNDGTTTTAPPPPQQELTQGEQMEKPVETKEVREAAENKTVTAASDQAPAKKIEPRKRNLPVRTETQPQALAIMEPQNQDVQDAPLPTETMDSKAINREALAVNETPKILEESFPLMEEVVISYRADEEPDAPTALAAADLEAAPAREKEISARKILGFFKKVTDNSGAGLAELREAKNELLSLNRLSRPE